MTRNEWIGVLGLAFPIISAALFLLVQNTRHGEQLVALNDEIERLENEIGRNRQELRVEISDLNGELQQAVVTSLGAGPANTLAIEQLSARVDGLRVTPEATMIIPFGNDVVDEHPESLRALVSVLEETDQDFATRLATVENLLLIIQRDLEEFVRFGDDLEIFLGGNSILQLEACVRCGDAASTVVRDPSNEDLLAFTYIRHNAPRGQTQFSLERPR
ncbi:MAG: hypothetical protein AAGA70_12475 [Pseudomonadota bacterium]